jgi:DnaJ-class molecular chaperone
MIKTIEELDFYDILNLRIDASLQEIEGSYLLAAATYHPDAPASHGVLAAKERQLILGRIEEAFAILRDPEKRKAYDALILPQRPEFQQRAFFRNSTERLEIEDASPEASLWERVRAAIPAPLRRLRSAAGRKKEDGKNSKGFQEGEYYYGEYLKRLRENRGLTLEEAARETGISLRLLQSLEDEEEKAPSSRKERIRILRRYALWLGLDSEDGRK